MDVTVALSREPLGDPRFTLIEKIDDTFIYQNLASMGRAYLVAAEPAGELPGIESLRHIDARIEEIERRADRLTLAFTSPIDGFLVIAMPVFPGWTAMLDGQMVPVEAIDGMLPAVRVEPGAHELIYWYSPKRVWLGAVLFVSGVVIVVIWTAGWWVFDRRRRSAPGRA